MSHSQVVPFSSHHAPPKHGNAANLCARHLHDGCFQISAVWLCMREHSLVSQAGQFPAALTFPAQRYTLTSRLFSRHAVLHLQLNHNLSSTSVELPGSSSQKKHRSRKSAVSSHSLHPMLSALHVPIPRATLRKKSFHSLSMSEPPGLRHLMSLVAQPVPRQQRPPPGNRSTLWGGGWMRREGVLEPLRSDGDFPSLTFLESRLAFGPPFHRRGSFPKSAAPLRSRVGHPTAECIIDDSRI